MIEGSEEEGGLMWLFRVMMVVDGERQGHNAHDEDQ